VRPTGKRTELRKLHTHRKIGRCERGRTSRMDHPWRPSPLIPVCLFGFVSRDGETRLCTCGRGLMRLRMGPKHGLDPHRHAPITDTRPFRKWSTCTQVGLAPQAEPRALKSGTRRANARQAKVCAQAALTRIGPAAAVARNTAMLCSRGGHRQKRGPCRFCGCGKCEAKNVSPLGDDSHDVEQTTLMPECTSRRRRRKRSVEEGLTS
jgi:hypothetical protein